MSNILPSALKAALEQWSWKTRPMAGLGEYLDSRAERVYGVNPLLFTRQQEVVDQMLNYNRQLGSPLTEAELIGGVNSFGKAQFDHYGSGYAVDSDPFNIARWSVAQALIDKGMSDAGHGLIKATDAQQALTSQQAIEIGRQAVDQLHQMNSEIDRVERGHSASFGDILGAVATGLGVAALPFAAMGALGATTAGTTGLATGEAALGSLGSGTLGVELGGLGMYGTTPAMAGGLGTGLVETSLASLGLDASALGGLGALTTAADVGASGFPLTQNGELAFDDAMQQGTGLNSPDTPWNTLNRTLSQTLAENPMLEQAVNTAKTVKSVVNAYNTLDGVYDMLTTDPQVQQSPLQQVQAQGRGYMTQPFGNRNFDAYR